MKTTWMAGACALVGLLGGWSYTPSAADGDPAPWKPRAAAAYLDQRTEWWTGWANAKRDHDTFCVSCHTATPYAIARPALRRALGEAGPSAIESRLAENVTKRVRMWKDVEPFYPDQTRGIPKTSESRGTEAILNALILATRDAGTRTLSDDTRLAFEPWEAERSPFYGATLAAIAIGVAPDGYAATPAIQDRVRALREYLRKGSETAHLFNRVNLLWASGVWPELLTREQQQSIVDAVRKSQRDDGGWSVASFADWKRSDGTPLDTRSDGYATGLVALALQSAGVTRADPQVRRALDWLVAHQDATAGNWYTASLNKQRDPASDAGKFMTDAATAYAALALTYTKP